jgi:elongation factor 2
VILVDALEGVMTQTETNIRLALQEMCKPVLYINKVNRLISELRLEPKEVLVRIDQIIREVNRLINKYAPKEFKGKRKVDFPDDSVAFGSAKDGRGVIFSMLKERGNPKQALAEIFEH